MSKSCFQAFDPSDYTEVRQYQNNPAFQKPETQSLRPLADKALVFFTRENAAYSDDTKKRHSHIPAQEQRKIDKTGKVAFPAFSMIPFQAFRVDRADFDEAVKFCCQCIRDNSDDEEGFGSDDTEALDIVLRDEFFENAVSFTAQSGRTYSRPQLLGVFALWKLDKALLAIKEDKASQIANLMVDVMAALQIADECYRRNIDRLETKKQKSQTQAKKGQNRHKHLDELRLLALQTYHGGNNGKKWRSVKRAAEYIYEQVIRPASPNSMSEEQAVTTISGWLTEADPDGEYSEYERKIKKAPG